MARTSWMFRGAEGACSNSPSLIQNAQHVFQIPMEMPPHEIQRMPKRANFGGAAQVWGSGPIGTAIALFFRTPGTGLGSTLGSVFPSILHLPSNEEPARQL
jgi:hypothetical protein